MDEKVSQYVIFRTFENKEGSDKYIKLYCITIIVKICIIDFLYTLTILCLDTPFLKTRFINIYIMIEIFQI